MYTKYTILSDEVLVENKGLKKHIKYELKLSALGRKIQYQSEPTLPYKLFTALFVVLPIILLFLTICG